MKETKGEIRTEGYCEPKRPVVLKHMEECVWGGLIKHCFCILAVPFTYASHIPFPTRDILHY